MTINVRLFCFVVAYVCQTITRPLYVRPRMHNFARYLSESGTGFKPIILEEHQRKLKMAQQTKPDIEPRLESAVMGLMYKLYALLNAVAIGVFIAEVLWFKMK